MADIIVVDDERHLAFMIADYLQPKHYKVRVEHDGVGLRNAMAISPADLVVLDLNMPGEDGFSLARWLREYHVAGILMLTAADTAFDRVAGLEVGADDYLSKPFALAELEARITAILRRRSKAAKNGAKALASGCYAFGSYVFDTNARRLVDVHGVIVPLTPMELDLVAVFATRSGQVLSRDEILDLAPPRGDDPFDRSIDSRITRLRRRLEADPTKPELIKTMRGAGYLYPTP